LRKRRPRGTKAVMRAFLLVVLAVLCGALGQSAAQNSATPADSVEPRRLWTGETTLSEESLFGQFRSYRDSRRFISEPILDGESLAGLLMRLGVVAVDAEAAANTLLSEAGLETLRTGTSVRVKFTRNAATVHQLAANGVPRGIDAIEVLVGTDTLIDVGRSQEGFVAASRPVTLDRRYVAAAGEINSSLFGASMAAGVPREMMINFADIFAFDVDFARQIKKGDRFEIVYELLYDQDGNEIAFGDILFAALTWNGKTKAKGYYRYFPEGAEKAGYYSADGRNPRTLLMKTPVNGARVTSRFGRRRHPVLGFVKGHAGIDFGAPTGTPVLAAGDGTIRRAAPTGTFGNYIEIDHSGALQTAYAHLQKYAPGIRAGRTVRQGEVIGYVGTTGRSTGPHLHYEVRHNGQPQNPETATVAVGETLTDEALEAFGVHRERVDSLRLQPFTVATATLQ
jgi:murein DD-endopeptidase MepM/ murein hydrolase activator NlpD